MIGINFDTATKRISQSLPNAILLIWNIFAINKSDNLASNGIHIIASLICIIEIKLYSLPEIERWLVASALVSRRLSTTNLNVSNRGVASVLTSCGISTSGLNFSNLGVASALVSRRLSTTNLNVSNRGVASVLTSCGISTSGLNFSNWVLEVQNNLAFTFGLSDSIRLALNALIHRAAWICLFI